MATLYVIQCNDCKRTCKAPSDHGPEVARWTASLRGWTSQHVQQGRGCDYCPPCTRRRSLRSE